MEERLSIVRRGKYWVLIVKIGTESQGRQFWYKRDAEKAREEFKSYLDWELKGLFNHHFQPLL